MTIPLSFPNCYAGTFFMYVLFCHFVRKGRCILRGIALSIIVFNIIFITILAFCSLFKIEKWGGGIPRAWLNVFLVFFVDTQINC